MKPKILYIYIPGIGIGAKSEYSEAAAQTSARSHLFRHSAHARDRLNPVRTAVPLRGQSTQILTSLSPKEDSSPKRVKTLSKGRIVRYILGAG